MNKFIISFVMAVGALAGCGNKPKAEITYGVLDNNVYSNEFFRLTIEKPAAWVAQSQAVNREMMETGANLVAGNDANLRAALRESQVDSLVLFSFYKFELGSPVAFNPSFASVAERVAHTPGIKTGKDYLFHAKNLLQSSALKYSFPEEVYSEIIDGVPFDVMPTVMEFPDMKIHQNYYTAKINDYILVFITSFTSSDELDELNAILQTVAFAKDG